MATGKDVTLSQDDTRDYSENNIVRFGADDLDIDEMDFNAALTALEAAGITVDEATADNIGDGFGLFDKDSLINKKCLFLDWTFSRPEKEAFGTPYVTIRGVTADGERFRFSDGSQGICRELIQLTDRRVKKGNTKPNAGLILNKGLSRSDYRTTLQSGEEIDATTYHISV